MVVLSVAVLSKSGKILVARQYVEMSRIRIEGILAAFPKLVDPGPEDFSSSGKQHTYVETGSIRYVYQVIESLYLVLVTTRGSNIVLDLDTLRLLSKVVPEYATHVSEEDISRNVFDLVFAFDEVVTLGYKENVTLEGIRTNLEMDSHSEKLAMMVEEGKINEARDEARRKAIAINAQKATNTMSRMQGMGSMMGGGMGSGMGSSPAPSSGSTYGQSSSSTDAPSKTGMKLGKGLKLGNKANKQMTDLEQMAKEEGTSLKAFVQQESSKAKMAAPGAVVRTDPIEVRLSESLAVLFDKDGALHKIEVKGSIQLLCHEADTKVCLKLQDYGDTSVFNFQPHPNLSKQDFADSKTLQLKNADKAWPKEKSLSILKWRYAAKEDESQLPLKVTCWPESNDDGTVTVSMELELLNEHLTLSNVLVVIPLNTSDEPEIALVEGGITRHNARRHLLEWELPVVDKETNTAQLEFVVASNTEDDFFPVQVSFSSEDTICPIHVAAVTNIGDQTPAKFGLYRQLQTERYDIVAQVE